VSGLRILEKRDLLRGKKKLKRINQKRKRGSKIVWPTLRQGKDRPVCPAFSHENIWGQGNRADLILKGTRRRRGPSRSGLRSKCKKNQLYFAEGRVPKVGARYLVQKKKSEEKIGPQIWSDRGGGDETVGIEPSPRTMNRKWTSPQKKGTPREKRKGRSVS